MTSLSLKSEILQTLIELGVSVDTESKLFNKLIEEYLPDDDIRNVKAISIVL